jgi:tetratricopeptide (TPR) repeat protein
MGEIQHVHDLFRRFGTAPIAEHGFIAAYLRSLDLYEQAQKEHTANDGNGKESANDPAIITRYREAAALLKLAIESSDAAAYPVELSKALVRRGLALFRAGDFEAAADQLEEASAKAADVNDRREALWFAIVSLDRAVQSGKVSLRARCDQLASMLVRQYPGSERAVALLPRLVGSSQISGDEAIKSLLEIPSESPLYLTARSEALRYLYAKFKQARPADREFIALQVADIGDEVIRLYSKLATSGLDQDSRDAAERLNVRARQVVDVILASPSPDPARAESLLQLIDSAAAYHAVPIDKLAPELEYYRFQIALVRNDPGQADVHYGKIQALAASNPDAAKFRALCENARFTRAVQAWSVSREDVQLSREVVRHGEAIIAREGDHSTPWFATVLDRTSAAAFVVWRGASEVPMRDLIIKIDGMLLSTTRTAAGLRRMAFALESLGRTQEALDAWREILSGVDEGASEWYEALVESIRLLSESDAKAAADLLKQHEVLHPDLGPEPWRTRLEDLKKQVNEKVGAASQPGTGGNR